MTVANTLGKAIYNSHGAENYFNPLATLANGTNYMFVGRGYPWPNDQNPPIPSSSVQNLEYQVFDDMIFGKIITSGDLTLMIDRYDWTANTVYAMYDDQDSNLFNKQYFVISPENSNYYVFKCLDNNGNSPSLYPPLYSYTSPEETFYESADGYVWKYMFTISGEKWNSFSTLNYAPIVADPSVVLNAVNGSIDAVKIEVGGNNFVSVTNGQFQSFSIAGNAQLYALDGSGSVQMTLSSIVGSFVVGETVSQGGNTATVSLYSAPFIELNGVNGQFGTNTIIGMTSGATAIPIKVASVGPSSNNNFYTNSAIYIQSGTGVGQLRSIIDYEILGTQRIITLNEPFSVSPDLTSHYMITPQVVITGDGTGAQAICYVNTSTYSVDSIKMIDPGQNYTWCNVNVIGNTGLYGIGSQYFGLIVQDATGAFTIGETVNQGSIASGTINSQNGSVARITVNSGKFDPTYEEFIIGSTLGIFAEAETVSQTINSISVSGTLHIVNSTYITISDIIGGTFRTGYTILGDTTAASANLVTATSLVGQTSNSTATLLSISSSAAQTRGIISPVGGHGSNPITELNANKVGVSVIFNNNEGNTIPTTGLTGNTQYRTIGLLQQPLFANVQIGIQYASNSVAFQIDEPIIQYLSANTIEQLNITNVANYTYNVGNYVSLSMNAAPFSVNDVVSQQIPIANGLVINVSGNTAIVRTDRGVFQSGSPIIKTSSPTTNANVLTVNSGFTQSVFGNDASNNIFVANTLSSYIQFYINNVELPDFTLLSANSVDPSQHQTSSSVLIYNYLLTNTDIITIKQYRNNVLISNSQYNASAKVSSLSSNSLNLTDVNNIFIDGSKIKGMYSNASANVVNVTTPSLTFNQTTRLTGSYVSSNTFNLSDTVTQSTNGVITAFGIVQGITQGSNSTVFVVSLTNVKGEFVASDMSVTKYINTVSAGYEVTNVQNPDLVKYSGNVVYIENIIPVTRSDTQSELNKIVLRFF